MIYLLALSVVQYCAIVDYFEKRKVARPLNFKVLSQKRKNLRIAQYCATVDYFKKRKVARPFFLVAQLLIIDHLEKGKVVWP